MVIESAMLVIGDHEHGLAPQRIIRPQRIVDVRQNTCPRYMSASGNGRHSPGSDAWPIYDGHRREICRGGDILLELGDVNNVGVVRDIAANIAASLRMERTHRRATDPFRVSRSKMVIARDRKKLSLLLLSEFLPRARILESARN